MQPPAKLNIKPTSGCSAEKRIVLVGATVRSAAQSARRAGFSVTGVDLFGDTDALQACRRHFVLDRENDTDQVAQACKGIPVMRVGGLHSHHSLVRRLSDVCPLLGPSLRVRNQLRDVAQLREFAENAGMRFPRTIDASSSLAPDAHDVSGRWLRKQHNSCGGLGIRWDVDKQSISEDELLQEWIPGRSFGATLLSDGSSARLLGVCRSLFQRNHHRPFVYAGSLGPIQVSPATSSSLRRLGEQIVAATKLQGLFNVDYVLDREENAWLLEINPRWSGSSELIERGLIDQRHFGPNESLFALAMDALVQAANPSAAGIEEIHRTLSHSCASTQPNSVYLKRVVFSHRDIRFDLSKFAMEVGPNESLHDVPAEGTVIRQREPLFTLVTKIDHNAVDPMASHRAMLRNIRTAIGRCSVVDYNSPRSSA
jgi:predicted ATP-grasp superfamily ATP-dependent carboligase